MLALVGKVVKTFGLRGEIKIYPYTTYNVRFQKGATLLMEDKEYVVKKTKPHQNCFIIQLEGVTKIEQAENLLGQEIFAKPISFDSKDAEGQYHYTELIGLEVFDEKGERIGNVENILPMPTDDLMKIGDILLPARKDFVRSVDIENKKIVVRLIEGMLEISE